MKEANTETISEVTTDLNIRANTEPKTDLKTEKKQSGKKIQTQEQKILRYALFTLFAGITIYLLYLAMNLWVTP